MRWRIKANGLASRVAAAIAGGVMAAFSVAGCGPGQNEDAAESYRTGLIFQITDRKKLEHIINLLGYDPRQNPVLHINFGLLEEECRSVLEEFFAGLRKNT